MASIISSKLAKKYAGPDVDAMKAIATAHENRSLEEYQEALKDHKSRQSNVQSLQNVVSIDHFLMQNFPMIL